MGNACAVSGRIENGNSASLSLESRRKQQHFAETLKIQFGSQLATSFAMVYVSTRLDCHLHPISFELLTYGVVPQH